MVIRNVKPCWEFGCTSGVKEPDIFVNICEYLSPRDLLHVSILNQTCRHLIESDLRLVIFVGLFHGGKAKRSLQNLYKQMLLEAIYIPNALRLLRIINGLRCEFCNENKVQFSRPQFPVFACWFCLHRGKHNSFGATEEQHNSLSSRWHKVVFTGRRFYMKQFHLANRAFCFRIFCHKRVLAYPTGLRFFTNTSGFLKVHDNFRNAPTIVGSSSVSTILHEPTTNKRRVAYTTKDAHEVMWTQRIRDSCGNPIGPYFTKSDVGKTVNFLKSFLNPEDCKHTVEEGINDYIDLFIVDRPDRSEYIPFVQYYRSMIE